MNHPFPTSTAAVAERTVGLGTNDRYRYVLDCLCVAWLATHKSSRIPRRTFVRLCDQAIDYVTGAR